MPITIGGGLPFCGRELTSTEWDLIREVTREFSGLGLTELARTICELLEWKRPNGGLKSRECYLFLLTVLADLAQPGLGTWPATAATPDTASPQHSGGTNRAILRHR